MKAIHLGVVLTFIFINANAIAFEMRLINGAIVDKGAYPAIIQIREADDDRGKCTATVVGKRTLITAAHCVDDEELLEFDVQGVTYSATAYPSELFNPDDEENPTDHDMAILIADSDILKANPFSVRGKVFIHSQIQIFGYGCHNYDITTEQATFDGNLRTGYATITGFSGYDMISGNGAALCFGDSGGPAFVTNGDGTKSLIGINSKGNIMSTNFNSRTDSETSQNFFWKIINEHDVSICGIDINC